LWSLALRRARWPADATLILGGGDDDDVAERLERLCEELQRRRPDAIVVADQDAVRPLLGSRNRNQAYADDRRVEKGK